MIPHHASKHEFPIIGIGASAGGLAALREFFQHTPGDMGMSFVVIMHLSPTYESNARELLQACTSMPVVEVSQPVHIDINTVYVISPNKSLEMIDGYLRVQERAPLTGWPIAIDVFFHTLAVAHESRAFAIVLSGTGNDGAAGLIAVKDHGGVVLVQSPEEAEFAGMPRAAIEAGVVDFVLPVKAMPAKLAALWANAQSIALPVGVADKEALAHNEPAPEPGLDEESFREILTVLRLRTGHDFARYKRATVLRRIERRLQVKEKQTLAQYRDLLRDERAESDALLKDMLIGVTQFFRDTDAFQYLEQDIIPQLFDGAESSEPLRVWSVGCSTGEETYSLAMLLAEYAAKSASGIDFQIFGSDIDERAIAVARAGVYGAAIAREVSQQRLSEHFNKEDGRYRIKKSVRDKILFANQNLMRDPPFSKLNMISCRNLLIYLNRDTHVQVLEMFHFALNPGGFLFLGSSESAESVAEFFVPVDKKHRIYRAKAASRLPRSSIPMSPPIALPTVISYPERANAEKPSFAGVHQRVLSEYAPPSALVDRQCNIVHLSEGTGQFLRHISGEPSRSLVDLVEPELRLELRAALFHAVQSGKSSETPGIRFERGVKLFYVNMVVRPFYDAMTRTDFILVLFHKVEQASEAPAVVELDPTRDAVLAGLEQELHRTKLQLQDTIENSETSNEELKAANEELQAINEELRSATEELETSKEELQSVNEELITVNYELKSKVDETSKVNDDLKNLIASTDLATIFVDRGMRIKRYTPHACDLFNLIASDVGRPLHDITHRLNYPELAKDAANTFESLRPVEREISSDDGRWFIARLLPYRTGLDQIDGAVLTFIDITSRRAAEDRVRAGEERMRLVAASTKDYAIITMDVKGIITSFNSGAERLFGYREEDIVGKPDDIIFTPEDRANGVPADERRRAREEGRAEDERWHQRKDGGRFFCSGILTPLRDGVLTGYAKIGRELTPRQEMMKGMSGQLLPSHKQLSLAQQDNAQKDQFLAIMSNELKQPLNLIHMHTEVLLRQPVVQSTSMLYRAVNAIRASTIGQAKIISDLLDLSRVSTGKLELTRTSVDLRSLVETIVEVIRATPDSPAIILDLPEVADVLVFADEARLEQVVWNLLSNAVKFTPTDGSVFVRLSKQNNLARIVVKDTGQGISPELLPSIFNMFQQGRTRSNRGVKGLGIGLALVQQIVQLHGGTVAVESPGPGMGSSFTVELPRVLPSLSIDQQDAETTALLSGCRMLLIDEHEDSLSVFKMLLEMESADVTAATSAAQALALLDTQAFDIVICDMSMTDMEAYEFAEQLRNKPHCRDLPALAVTGLGRQEDIDRAMRAGFSGHLEKPIDITELALKVGRLIMQGEEL